MSKHPHFPLTVTHYGSREGFQLNRVERGDATDTLLLARAWSLEHGRDAALEALCAMLDPAPETIAVTTWANKLASGGGSPECRGSGVLHRWSLDELAAHQRVEGTRLCPKEATGWSHLAPVLTHGESAYGGSLDEECIARSAVLLDNDDLGLADGMRALVDTLGLAYVFSQRNAANATRKQHWTIPYTQPLSIFKQGEDPKKGPKQLYSARLGVLLGLFSTLGGLDEPRTYVEKCKLKHGVGFDPKTNRLLQLEYLPTRRAEADAPPTIEARAHGLAIDYAKLAAWADNLIAQHTPVSWLTEGPRTTTRTTTTREPSAPRVPRVHVPVAPLPPVFEEPARVIGEVIRDGMQSGLHDGYLALSGTLAHYLPHEFVPSFIARVCEIAGSEHPDTNVDGATRTVQRIAADEPVIGEAALKESFPDIHAAVIRTLDTRALRMVRALYRDGRVITSADWSKPFVRCPECDGEARLVRDDRGGVRFGCSRCANVDLYNSLGDEAREIIDQGRATGGRARLDAMLAASVPENTVSLAEARKAMECEFALPDPNGVVLDPNAGTGKTHAALNSDLRIALLFQYHYLVKESVDLLHSRGERPDVFVGIVAKGGCKFQERAELLQREGGSVPQIMCRSCVYRNGCEARQGETSDDDTSRSRFIVATQQLYRRAVERVNGGILYQDETPAIFDSISITRDELASVRAHCDTGKLAGFHKTVFPRDYRTQVRPLVVALQGIAADATADDIAAAVAPAVAAAVAARRATVLRAQGRRFVRLRVPQRLIPYPDLDRTWIANSAYNKVHSLVGAAAYLAITATETGTPRVDSDDTRTKQRVFHDHVDTSLYREFLRQLGILTRVQRIANALLVPRRRRKGTNAITGCVLSDLAKMIRERRPIIGDATAPELVLRWLVPSYRFLRLHVKDNAPITREILYRADLSIGKVREKDERGVAEIDWGVWERGFVDALQLAREADVRKLAVVTFKDVEDAIRNGQATACVVDAIDAWIGEGREIEWGHFYGLRGSNRWKTGVDGIASVGDPWGDIGATRDIAEIISSSMPGCDLKALIDALTLEEVRAELEQVHGRLRDVSRTEPAWHLHVGVIAPGRWHAQNTTVLRVATGHPQTSVVVDLDLLRAYVSHHGGVTSGAAVVAGVSEKFLYRVLSGDRYLQPDALARLAVGVYAQFDDAGDLVAVIIDGDAWRSRVRSAVECRTDWSDVHSVAEFGRSLQAVAADVTRWSGNITLAAA